MCAEERVLLHRSFRCISLDENDINQRVALLLGKPVSFGESLTHGWCLGFDSHFLSLVFITFSVCMHHCECETLTIQ